MEEENQTQWKRIVWASKDRERKEPKKISDLSEDKRIEEEESIIEAEALGRDYISPWTRERLSLNKKARGGENLDPCKPTPRPLSIVINELSEYDHNPKEDPFKNVVSVTEIFRSDADLGDCQLLPTIPNQLVKLKLANGQVVTTSVKFEPVFSGDNDYLNGKIIHDDFQKEIAKDEGVPLWDQDERMNRWFRKPNNKIQFHLDRCLTKLSNSTPDEDPLAKLGAEKLYELSSVFNPQALHVVDPLFEDPRAILYADVLFRRVYGDQYGEINPEKTQVIEEHFQYLKSIDCDDDYLSDCRRSEDRCWKRIKKYIKKVKEGKELSVDQHIADAYYLFFHYQEAYRGLVTQRRLKEYLIKYGHSRFKDPRYLEKTEWNTYMRRVTNFIPLTSSDVRGKAIVRPEDPDVVALRNGQPTNASGSQNG